MNAPRIIIMNTFIHQNGRETDRQYIQQTKQKKRKNMHIIIRGSIYSVFRVTK